MDQWRWMDRHGKNNVHALSPAMPWKLGGRMGLCMARLLLPVTPPPLKIGFFGFVGGLAMEFYDPAWLGLKLNIDACREREIGRKSGFINLPLRISKGVSAPTNPSTGKLFDLLCLLIWITSLLKCLFQRCLISHISFNLSIFVFCQSSLKILQKNANPFPW